MSSTSLCISSYHDRKMWLDRILAMLMLVVATPLIAMLLLLVKLTSRGAAIYYQSRVGKGGKEFLIYKIRTMTSDAEADGAPRWSAPGDSRITLVGRVLRFLHLDELPQLVNVIRGEMSLIGPRPERPEFVALLARRVPNYKDRLAILPGVTGLAQINLPPDESLACVQKKILLDREYVERATLLLDLRILICTFLRMIGIRHGKAARWLRIEHEVAREANLRQDERPRTSTSTLFSDLMADDLNDGEFQLPTELSFAESSQESNGAESTSDSWEGEAVFAAASSNGMSNGKSSNSDLPRRRRPR